MAAFTASPVPPRRTNRTTPRLSPPPRRVARGGKPTSRLGTPARSGTRPPSSSKGSSPAPYGMDIDEGLIQRALRPNAVFAKSNELLVAFHAHLPAEVKQILRNADFFRDAYSGGIDTSTGFALVATSQTCFVWQHTQGLLGIPTCYIFSCPVDYSQAAPFHSFVPYGSSREPGLVLLSPSGEIRCWDSIGIGLAGGEHYSKIQLELEAGENTTSLTRSDPQTYIASTSRGRLFRFTLTSTGGKYHLTSRLFSRPYSSLSLSRFFPVIWASPVLQPEAGSITAIALGAKNNLGRDIWALIESRIQQWNMASEGWEEIVFEEDVMSIIRPALQELIRTPSAADFYLDVELLDVAFESSGKLVFLTSHSGTEDDTSMDTAATPRRIYSLIHVSLLAGISKVEKVISVPYQSTFGATEAPMQPRLQLMSEGALMVVQFGDAIAVCARDTEYKDRVALKSAMDRTLGVGVVDNRSELLILTASTMMKAIIDIDQVSNFHPETGRSNLIQSIMTQAIMYGSYSENPLSFSFPPEVNEDSLMSGAEQLSRAILESDHLERLSFLIKFINENGVLGKISQRSRQQLAIDAEKLYAAQQLWPRLNRFPGAGRSYGVLNDAIVKFMYNTGEGHHDDLMRAFFRLRIHDLGKLLPYVADFTRRSLNEAPEAAGDILSESNNVLLTMLNSAFEYREYNHGIYGIELPLIKPWTSRLEVIDLAIELFDSTTALVESGTEMTVDEASEPKSQLPDLASLIFACMTERLDWLKSAVAGDDRGVERERSLLEDRFRQLRPEVLDTLRRNGFADHAFKLAEQYRDFRSLASLCNKDVVYPIEENPHALVIQSYIEKFRDEFTEELYHWYIEHGELRAMFAQEDVYGDYMDRFFAKHSYPSISWIHDLNKYRWSAAAETLLSESQDAGELSGKTLMLSIGKLSHLAHLQEDEDVEDERLLDAFHDGLDFVSVHEMILGEFRSALAAVRGKQSVDAQVDTITRSQASKIADKRSLPLVFKQLVRLLLQGKVLSVEDVADILSLKDNTDTTEDYATALHLLARANNLPEGRRLSAFRAVWRRIYIHDDWHFIKQTAGITDDELNERFRNTALFSVLSATLPKRHQPEGYILSPAQALAVPSVEEIGEHWPSMSPDQVEGLAQDYREESETLEAYGLGEAYERAKELVLEQFISGQS
ncbi:hypothetical protein EW146_g3080 [Bondarzewia mesenterica]|uniref:Nucleoporin Nup133/Nup155-like C-terminal domain-containing protein n=1 Tax=Bondarzewia mesenterica TaxID=1095465 RepID=A0A4S4LYY7_9AGAM|nr:hypothetical protein EW146_g3080 [Bondarzewia mesenterica]